MSIHMTNKTRAFIRLLTMLGVPSFFAPTATMAQANDTIYPTDNTWWPCTNASIQDTFYCATDNAALYVFIESSVEWTTGASNIWSQLLNQYDPTDLRVIWEEPPVYEGTSQTDIIYQSRNDLPTGLLGATWCDEPRAGSVNTCDQHYVAFASTIPSWEVACHESGHAIGLTHGEHAAPALSNTSAAIGCMRNPVFGSGVWTIGALNTQNINNVY